MSPRCLILPCETRSREFDAKLLLATVAAARGIASVIGAKKTIDLNLAGYPPGVYVGKSLTARSRHNLALARACGHRVALWDEEGLVWASREVYWRTKVDGAALNAPELLIAWGEENAAAWREHPEYAGTAIAVAGNPRADLLRPGLCEVFAGQAARLRAEHGRFVLINTNFSRVNHLQPRQNRHLTWLREQRPDDPRGGFAAHKFALYHAFQELLPALSEALPDTRLVVRPHPSEALAPWQALAAGSSNVVVVREGHVAAWLLAAEALVHNGCTTAVEAFVLGCPALAYMPVRSPGFDHPLPNGVSVCCDTAAGLIARLRDCLSDREAAFARQSVEPARQAMLASNLAGFDAPTLASERICEALRPLLDEPEPSPGSHRGAMRIVLALRRFGHAIEQRIPGAPNYRPYLRQMFPDTTPDAARARVVEFAERLDLSPPRVEPLQDNVFRLSGAVKRGKR